MNKKAEQGRATRRQLIDAATRLFAAQGYDATSTAQVLDEAGVSRGSLYHHFDNKESLFEAVLEDVEAMVVQRLLARAETADDAVDALRRGCAAWVDMADDPVVRRIALIDAPAVVGWQRWREIDEKYAFGLLKMGLQAVAAEGRLPADQVDVVAHLLLAALVEAAMVVARADDPEAARRDTVGAVHRLIDGLVEA